MIQTVGQMEIVVCDHCHLTCENEVIAVTHYVAGREDEADTKHFCSVVCQEEHSGIPERISKQSEAEVRRELNTMHRLVCPKCQSRIKRAFE